MLKTWKKKEIDQLKDLAINKGYTWQQIADKLNRSYDSIKHAVKRYIHNDSDIEIVKENVRISKNHQKIQDKRRIETKSFRDHVRLENAVAEYNKKLIEILKKHEIPQLKKSKTYKSKSLKICLSKNVGIFHLTDLHFNELIDLEHNKYDFTIAAKRLKKFVNKAKDYFKVNNVKKILIACTADFINSDRRIDELLSQSTNRSKATFLALVLLRQVIEDLYNDFDLTIANVVGNESRISKDMGWADIVATDNYDYTIYNMLKLLFKKTKDIKFVDGNPLEVVVNVNGQNVLLVHGIRIPARVLEGIRKLKSKYVARGIVIDFVIFGHLHSTDIGDSFARGGSLVGSNSFSDGYMNVESRASQNIHIMYPNGERDSIKIDLQEYNDIEGYEIKSELANYNAKSIEQKTKKKGIVTV